MCIRDRATEYFVVICAHLCITFLDRHDMLIPFCPADCLFLFSIKTVSYTHLDVYKRQPFLISTGVGAVIAGILVFSLQRSGVLRSMQSSLS